jgi:hypothetical protein
MKSGIEFKDNRIEFKFEREEDDNIMISSLKYSMTDDIIFVDLPAGLKDIHSDLIGVAAIMLCNPFIGSKLTLPKPVSRKFYQMVSGVISRYKIVENVDEDLEPLEIDKMGRPGLSFSGGADSAAALAIMPPTTISIFLNRPLDISRGTYNSHAPLEICRILKRSGYDVHVVDSNLENIRNPAGFPTDLANAIPCILLSRHLGLDSIAFGTVLESAYGIGQAKFNNYGEGSHWRFFSTIFSSVGIELSLPTIGISEVGTAIIGMESPIASIGQSCIRGTYQKSCMKCWKCFRKELLIYALDHKKIEPDFLKMLKTNEIQIRLSAFPISHENVITYSVQQIDLDKNSILKPIARKLDTNIDLSFLNKWFSDSIEFVPDKYRNHIRNKILDFLEPMSFDDSNKIINWDMNPYLSSNKAINSQDRLISYWQDIDLK